MAWKNSVMLRSKLGLAGQSPDASISHMSKAEILAELPKLSAGERDEVRHRLAELDDENADAVALSRAEELARGLVKPKTQTEIFRNARAALS